MRESREEGEKKTKCPQAAGGADRCVRQPWGQERGAGGWGLAALFSELLSLSASAKLLNCHHILEGVRPACQEDAKGGGEVGLELHAGTGIF